MASSSINKSLAGKGRIRAVPFSFYSTRHGHVIRETNEAFIFQMDLPGIGEDDIDVYVEGKNLIFKAKYADDDVDMTGGRGRTLYGTVLTENGEKTFDEREFKLDEINTQMKNGVLKIVLPKLAPA